MPRYSLRTLIVAFGAATIATWVVWEAHHGWTAVFAGTVVLVLLLLFWPGAPAARNEQIHPAPIQPARLIPVVVKDGEAAMSLNDYSSRFLPVLLARCPEVRGSIKERDEPGEEGCFVVICHDAAGGTVWLQTEEKERITVMRGNGHSHFGGWAEADDECNFNEAADYLRRLLDGLA